MTQPNASEALREALAVDLGQTHDHKIGVHDSFERVFAAQAEALIARGWTLATPPRALDALIEWAVEREQEVRSDDGAFAGAYANAFRDEFIPRLRAALARLPEEPR